VDFSLLLLLLLLFGGFSGLHFIFELREIWSDKLPVHETSPGLLMRF
jgi:hypothetical protein